MSTVMGRLRTKDKTLIVESVVDVQLFLLAEFLQGIVYHGQWVCYTYLHRLFKDWSGFRTTLFVAVDIRQLCPTPLF